MQKKIRDIAHKLLREHDVTLNLVDIGSRNGVLQIPDLAPFTDAYGFEPNPEEYDKLITGETDAAKFGIISPPYRSLRYYPYAISNTIGKRDFYVTPGPGAAGLLEPNLSRLKKITCHGGKRYRNNFGREVFDDYEIIEVETTRLDEFCKQTEIKHIDLLKVDVEGSEYEVFEGSTSILPHTGIIYVETCFIPFRKNQKLFSHVDLLLRKYNFDLLHFEIVQGQIGYKILSEPTQYVPPYYYDPYGQPLSADAIYVNEKIADQKRALAQSIILLEKNFIDEALFVLRTRAHVDDNNIYDILIKTDLYFTPGQRIRRRGYKLVDDTVTAIGALLRKILKTRIY